MFNCNRINKLITIFIFWGMMIPAILAQKPLENRHLERFSNETEDFYRFKNKRVSKETGAPLALYRVNYTIKSNRSLTPQEMARRYLQDNARMLKIERGINGLQHTVTRETPGGYHVRFLQTEQGYPVYNGDLVVNLDRSNKVTFVINSYKPLINLQNPQPSISLEAAVKSAKSYLNVKGKIHFQNQETCVYYRNRVTRLAHKITIIPAEDTYGNWEILIDAHTGEIFRVEDKALYVGSRGRQRVDGSGWVFDPDPLTHARANYQAGGQFGDNNDADSDSLLAHIVQRTLPEIEFSGNMYHLNGPYAHVVDIEAPFNGLFSQPINEWHFTREPDAFEAANVYFHIDQSMRYINETLGFNLAPFQYAGGVQIDPHGLSGADNSHYLPGTGQIAWGEGGVDDAEDADVVLHELGHGLHDWLTNGSLSQVDGLSEGFGDYWTTSYNRSRGFWTPGDPQYFWVFQWDGHNEFWPGRITNYTALYPGGLTGGIHTDGQIWSSTLMQIYEDIGRTATDSDVLEALSMTNSSSSQQDAAQAFVQADVNLFNGANLDPIVLHFTNRGYTFSVPTPQITHIPLGDSEDLNGPYEVSMTVSTSAPVAQALLIHGTDSVFTDTTDMVFNGNQYQAFIPGNGIPTHYNYYIFVADSIGLASTSPENAPLNFHSFSTGVDSLNPVITHTPINGANMGNLPVSINAEVTDNGSVGSVWVDYMINSVAQDTFHLQHQGSNIYSGEFGFGVNDVTPGDSIQYRIYAQDISAALNLAIDPDSGYHTFSILNILSVTKIVNIPIPDNDPLGVSDVFTITGSATAAIQDVDVIFKAQHTWIGDLIVKLTAPDGTQITLMDRPGVPGSSFGHDGDDPDVIFDDDAPESIEDVTIDPVVGTFHPDPGVLSDFNGINHTGDWIIFISDNAGADTGTLTEWGFTFTLEEPLVSIDGDKSAIPDKFALHKNFPNPFNPATTIRYDLRKEVNVSLKIYNILGQEIRVLLNRNQTGGRKQIQWDGFDNNGNPVSSGIYVYRLEAGEFVKSRKMILLK